MLFWKQDVNNSKTWKALFPLKGKHTEQFQIEAWPWHPDVTLPSLSERSQAVDVPYWNKLCGPLLSFTLYLSLCLTICCELHWSGGDSSTGTGLIVASVGQCSKPSTHQSHWYMKTLGVIRKSKIPSHLCCNLELNWFRLKIKTSFLLTPFHNSKLIIIIYHISWVVRYWGPWVPLKIKNIKNIMKNIYK